MITAPCQSFAVAYTKVGANGIVAALDPGKYGSLNLQGPVTINGNGWAAVTGPANGPAIAISAGSGSVILKGLEIDGAGTSPSGINFFSGTSLTISDCSVQNFTNTGIFMEPSTGNLNIAITNTTVSSNGFGGIRYVPISSTVPTANIVIDHAVVTSNTNAPGIAINTSAGGGATTVAILNSISSGNQDQGIFIDGIPLTVTIDSTDMLGNATGVWAEGLAIVSMGRSVITGNTNNGVINQIPGAFFSYADNRINGNGSSSSDDVITNPLTSAPPK
jgi:hypothetical protein